MAARFRQFAKRREFYALRCRKAVHLEGAYYALLFWEGLIEPSRGTDSSGGRPLFSVVIQTRRGLQHAGPICEDSGIPGRHCADPIHYESRQLSGGMDSEIGESEVS